MSDDLVPYRALAGSPIGRLAAAGVIDKLELRAAWEIRTCAEAVGASRCLRTMQYGERVDTSLPATFALPGAYDLGSAFRRYETWCVAVSEAGWPLVALLSVIALGLAPRRLERRLQLRSGTLRKIIEPALLRYVEISGWKPVSDG